MDLNTKNIHSQVRTAILFDAENISYRFAEKAIELAKPYGKPILRAYADFSRQHLKGWEQPALKHGIRTIHQFSYDNKNSSSDFLMMHDAFKLIHSGKIDTFVIVTNDSDFITPIQLLRQSGAFIHGLGNLDKCSELLTSSCNQFNYLDAEFIKIKASPSPKPVKTSLVSKKIISKLVSAYRSLEKTKKGWVMVSALCSVAEIPKDQYSKFSTLLTSSGRFELGDKNRQTKLIN
ncbi:MAG: NYN domain-containing protein [Endozoicomonas sp.]|uniref:NYN domain-containing protein n=1 Tax=Endozoicomonas sp. TaxID=1892382 RepID=UPI003D9B1813